MAKPNNYVAALRKLLKGTPMQQYAPVIARVEARYKLPKGLLAGIARAESSFGTAGRDGHQTNPFGWMSSGGPSEGLMPFANMAAAIRHVGRTLGERGWTDPAKFQQTYVGSTGGPWLGNVQSVMSRFGSGPPTAPPKPPKRTPNGSTPVSISDPDINRKMMLMTVLMASRSSSSGNSMAAMLPLLMALKSPPQKGPTKTIGNVGPTPVEVGKGVTGREKEVQQILGVAKKFLGTKYVFGSAGGRSDFGKSPSAFDCSGFVAYVWFKATGKKLPAYTNSLQKLGREVPKGKMQPGDALFFDTYQQYGHIGLYLGNGKMIHASSSGAVKISTLADYLTPSSIRRFDV